MISGPPRSGPTNEFHGHQPGSDRPNPINSLAPHGPERLFGNGIGIAYPLERKALSGILLVTGGSRGIGAACARLAGRCGYTVCVNYLGAPTMRSG